MSINFSKLPLNLKREIIKKMNKNSKISSRVALTGNKEFYNARKRFAQIPFRRAGGPRYLNSYNQSTQTMTHTNESYAAKEANLKNKIKRVIPNYVVKEIFPGYAGHNTLNTYVNAYGSRQLINRIPRMVNEAQNRINMRLNQNLKKRLNQLSARMNHL